MNKPKVYIDGKEGTTGLQIYDRLAAREDIELLLIEESKRKDVEERKKMMHQADLVFLCLPDAAAKEAVSLMEYSKTKVIDASTAHRTAPGWVYGFPELSKKQKSLIETAKRVANPGCHATGVIASVYPLVSMGILPQNYPLTVFSLTGYSGGGKKMIAQYEVQEKDEELYAPRIYGLNLKHKHLPEIQNMCGLSSPPVFCPIVDDYKEGMATTILLHNASLNGHYTASELWKRLKEYYDGQTVVQVEEFGGETPMIAANQMAGKDGLKLIVCGHEEQTIVTALFDNLGKGASGAAVQNMNLMFGMEETRGLHL